MIYPIEELDGDLMAMVEDLWRKQREIIDYLNEETATTRLLALAAMAIHTGSVEDLEKYLEERRNG